MIKALKFPIKVSFSLLLLALLYKHIFIDNSLSVLITAFLQEFVPGQMLLMPLVLVLMFVNWGLESKKWQLLTEPIYPLTYKEAVRHVIAGVSFAIFTPNRIGEYGGRILFFPKELRLRSVLITIVGSVSHMIICLVCGVGGVLLWVLLNPQVEQTLFIIVVACALGFAGALGFIYFNINKIPGLIKKSRWRSRLTRLVKIISILKKLDKILLQEVLLWSLFRYLTYTVQYIILLHIFGVELHPAAAVAAVMGIFFTQFFVPAPAIAELGVRSSIAAFFLAPFTSNIIGVVTAATALWLINLVIPAIFGAVLVVMRLLKRDVV